MDHLKHPRNPVHLFLGFAMLFLLAAYVNIFPPEQIVYIITFFILLFVALTLLGLYIWKNTQRAAIVSFGVIVYFILRYFGLRHPLYAILLIASIIAIEYLWKRSP